MAQQICQAGCQVEIQIRKCGPEAEGRAGASWEAYGERE